MAPKRLLLIAHDALDQDGGHTARWRSFRRHLREFGWEVEAVRIPVPGPTRAYSQAAGDRRRFLMRERAMSALARSASPIFRLLGIRPEAMPLSMALVPAAALQIRRRLRGQSYDAVAATGPPFTAHLAARLAVTGGSPPLLIDFRDLWAGNPNFDRRGSLLTRIEAWVLATASAVTGVTPAGVERLRRRHPTHADRIVEISNGFEPELLERRLPGRPQWSSPITLLHSGSLPAGRPLAPLLRVLSHERHRSEFRLVLQGHLAPERVREVAQFRASCDIDVVPPSTWVNAIERVVEADAALVVNSASVGDDVAVPTKLYEYLALGKPVVCISHGGEAEALLKRLGAAQFCARLDDEGSIGAALERLRTRGTQAPVSVKLLNGYDRRRAAARMAELLDRIGAAAEHG